MKKSVTFAAIMLVSVVITPSLHAQSAEQTPPWKGNLEMAYLQTSGNTDTETFLLGGKVERSFSSSKLTGEGKALYGQKDGETTDKNWTIKLKYDKNITERFYGFLLGSVERDPFKGIEYRYTTQAGLGYDFIKTSSDLLKGEVGAGYIWEHPTPPLSNRDYPTSRLFGEYEHTFNEKSRI